MYEITPKRITSAPIDNNPATSAPSSICPEIRVSRPMITLGVSDPLLKHIRQNVLT